MTTDTEALRAQFEREIGEAAPFPVQRYGDSYANRICAWAWEGYQAGHAAAKAEAAMRAAAPTANAAPVAQGDALPREEFAWMVVQEACETEPADEDDPECIRILRRDLKSAVLAAFLREDAARMDKEGDQHG